MSAELHPTYEKDESDRIPLWERQVTKILKRHPLASTRTAVAQKLAWDWNANIGGAHEGAMERDARNALKRVEKNDLKALKALTPEQQEERPLLSKSLYELKGSDELRKIILKREQKRRYGTLHSIKKRPKKQRSMVYIWPIDTSIQPLSVIPEGAQVYKWKEEDLTPKKKEGMSMFQLARSGFSLPRLADQYDSPLTEIAESGFSLPKPAEPAQDEMQALRNESRKQQLKEKILQPSIPLQIWK